MSRIFVFLMILVGSRVAHGLACHAQLIRSLCGSGEVKLEIDEAKSEFRFKQGDVGCWYTDYKLEGTVDPIEPRHPYFLPGYELEFSDEGGGKRSLGALHFDKDKGLARLELKASIPGAFGNKYDLNCK
jgi:hypothetical protein